MQMLDRQAARLTKVMTTDEIAEKHQNLGAAEYPWENWFGLREHFQRFLAARPPRQRHVATALRGARCASLRR